MRKLILITALTFCMTPVAMAQDAPCGEGPSTVLDGVNGSGENRDLREAQGGGGPKLGFSTCDRENGPARFDPQFDRSRAVDDLTQPQPKADPVWGIVKTDDTPIVLPTEPVACIKIEGLSAEQRAQYRALGKTLCAPES